VLRAQLGQPVLLPVGDEAVAEVSGQAQVPGQVPLVARAVLARLSEPLSAELAYRVEQPVAPAARREHDGLVHEPAQHLVGPLRRQVFARRAGDGYHVPGDRQVEGSREHGQPPQAAFSSWVHSP